MKSTHQLNQKELDSLYKAILKLETLAEAKRFFRDLCTHEELVEMSKRWQAAQLLDSGKSYRDVAAETGLSTTTVARVAEWLERGRGGYRMMLGRE